MLPPPLPARRRSDYTGNRARRLAGDAKRVEALIERTAMSPFIREKKDFYAALFDGEGRLIVGSNLPIFGDAITGCGILTGPVPSEG